MNLGIGGHQSTSAGSIDWLTPQNMLSALGEFDLDPCAAPLPRPWDTAREMWTQDGLEREWHGRVWLNPPYGREVGDWINKLADYGRGIALVFARTETDWFQNTVFGHASGVLFLAVRLTFCRPDGRKADHNAGAPSCLVAFGEDDEVCLQDCRLKGQFVNRGPHGEAWRMILREKIAQPRIAREEAKDRPQNLFGGGG